MRFAVLVLPVLLLGSLVACSDDDTAEAAPSAGEPAAAAALEEDRVVIDVRTPEEFAAGHVEGAANIDVQAPGFDDEIAALDTDVDYVVYCRSGNRSAAAAERMRDAGLDVLDGGGLGTMLDAGWPAA